MPDSERAPRGGYAGRSDDLTCAECGARMELVEEEDGPLYVCVRIPQCDGTHGAHPDGTPLGEPGDAETRRWRRRCHERLDRLWKEQGYTREEAYELLQKITGRSPQEAHVSRLDAATCREVIARLEDLNQA